MMDWIGDSRGGLRPEDVFHTPHQWRSITRQEAALICDKNAVVTVLHYGPTLLRSTWFDQAHQIHYGPGPYEAHWECYYVYEGPAPTPHNRSWDEERDHDGGSESNTTSKSDTSQSKKKDDKKDEDKKKQDDGKKKDDEKPKQIVCELTTADVKCGHGRVPSKDGVLEVVARKSMDWEGSGKQDDKISLSAQLKGGCGDHPRWDVGGTITKGTTAEHVATPWSIKSFEFIKRGFKVREKAIAVSACDSATKNYTIREYPGDQVEITVTWNREMKHEKTQEEQAEEWRKQQEHDDKAAAAMDKAGLSGDYWRKRKEAERAKKTHKAFKVDFKWKPESNTKINYMTIIERFRNWASQLAYVEDMIEKVAAPEGENKIEILPKVEGKFKAAWMEYTDWRVYLKLEAELAAELISAEATIPFGPFALIPPTIKNWVGDVGFYIKFNGSLGISFKWAIEGPDKGQSKFSGGAEGEIGVVVGANLFLMKKTVLNIDVNGSTKVTPSAEASFEDKEVVVEYDIMWGGLKVAITAEALWGMVGYKKEWTVMEKRSMIGGKKKWLPFSTEGAAEAHH